MSIQQLHNELIEAAKGKGLLPNGEIDRKEMRAYLLSMMNGAENDRKRGVAQGRFDDKEEQIDFFMSTFGLHV